MWENVGMARTAEGLQKAIDQIKQLRSEFWKDVKVTGTADGINIELEKANRVADFLEIGELMARDALNRKESAGGHFRDEYQTEENEAKRDDDDFCHVAAWEYTGDESEPIRNIEELSFPNVPLSQRSYK
jgi:succinate dehydrogenase / fumarate reductase flavoprotein subunit